MWLVSDYLVIPRAREWSILVFAVGVTVFLGGWRALRWAWPSIVFLVFMFPLPGAVQSRLSLFLQKIGTICSVYVIQTLGIPAMNQGNKIFLQEGEPLEVADVCSGIRMLMLFFAICVGAAFWLRCPLWKKAVIVLSAPPIAVVSNVFRITLTACLRAVLNPELAAKAQDVVHDTAGLLMMPLGLVLLLGVWKLLDKLVIDRVPEGPLALGSPIPMKPSPADSHSTNNP
jgi:exosortase